MSREGDRRPPDRRAASDVDGGRRSTGGLQRRHLLLAGAGAALATAGAGVWLVTSKSAPAEQVARKNPAFGVAAGGFYDTDAVSRFSQSVGIPMDYCLPVFSDVADGLSGERLRAVAARGFIPEVTWQPGRASVVDIAVGRWDEVLGQAARYTAGMKLRIRFGHEMNGTWGPSSEHPADYVRAFRRAHSIFFDHGSTPAWVWTPNVSDRFAVPFGPFYPGDEYCDLVGLDGYAKADNGHRPFRDLFEANFSRLASISGRPLVVGETGVASTAPDRATWVADMFDWLGEHPAVRGLTWWNRDQYAITDDEDAVAAFARGGARWRALAVD